MTEDGELVRSLSFEVLTSNIFCVTPFELLHVRPIFAVGRLLELFYKSFGFLVVLL